MKFIQMKNKIEKLMKSALVRRIKAKINGMPLIYKFEGELIRDLYSKWLTL
jgi:hypothetical protein